MTTNTTRAVAPATDPPSFPDPVFFPARRIHGLVETPGGDDSLADEQSFVEGGRPPALQRRISVSGNVLLLEHAHEGTKAFLLQRKVGTSSYGGSVRVGFCLQGNQPTDEDGLWHVVMKESSASCSSSLMESRKRDHAGMEDDIRDRCEMVTVYIERESTLLGVVNEGAPTRMAHATDTLKTEMAALQWIAKKSNALCLDHLRGSTYMGKDSGWICAILSPWNSDGTLLDYCVSHPNGTLPLEEVRFFFKQILQGLQQLQSVGICHRSISLDTVLLEGRHCRLAHYGSALRIPVNEGNGSAPLLITPQPVGGRYPELVAPELWAQQAFDGHAVDMWSAGIALWKMVVQKVELFCAPVPDDYRFRDLCLEGKLKDRLKPEGLPDGIVDLLEGMLRVNPADRYTLGDALKNSWVVQG